MRELILSLVLLLLAACSTIGNPALMDDSVVNQIKIGETSRDQVRLLLGVPSSSTMVNVNGNVAETWGYVYAHSEIKPLALVPIINLIVMACCGMSETESRSIAVGFAPDGLVRSIAKGALDYPARPGMIPVRTQNSIVIQSQ